MNQYSNGPQETPKRKLSFVKTRQIQPDQSSVVASMKQSFPNSSDQVVDPIPPLQAKTRTEVHSAGIETQPCQFCLCLESNDA